MISTKLLTSPRHEYVSQFNSFNKIFVQDQSTSSSSILHLLRTVYRIGEDPLEEPNNLMPYVAQVGYDDGDHDYGDDNEANHD